MRIFSLLLLVLVSVSLQGCFTAAPPETESNPSLMHDRLAARAFVADEKIEIAIAARISKEIKTDAHVNATSFNRKVLITGEVPDKATKAEIGKIVASTENVLGVNNELVISANSSPASRNNDSLITDKVRQRLTQDKRIISNLQFSADYIKVVTGNGVVFLTGTVSRARAEAAADVAGSTSGVKRVAKLFEYVD